MLLFVKWSQALLQTFIPYAKIVKICRQNEACTTQGYTVILLVVLLSWMSLHPGGAWSCCNTNTTYTLKSHVIIIGFHVCMSCLVLFAYQFNIDIFCRIFQCVCISCRCLLPTFWYKQSSFFGLLKYSILSCCSFKQVNYLCSGSDHHQWLCRCDLHYLGSQQQSCWLKIIAIKHNDLEVNFNVVFYI